MTKRVAADEILSQKNVRFFIQPGGASPENPVLYSGVSNTYLNVESFPNPIRGGISPINVHDPRSIGRYRQVGNTVDAPDFATFTIQFLQKKDTLPRHLIDILDCYFNLYQVVGSCKDPSDFLAGWSAYVKVASTNQVTQPTEAGGAFDGDDRLMDEVEATSLGGIYNVGKEGFSEKAAIQVYSQVKGITFGNRVQCSSCGPADNASKLVYAVTDNTVASPGQAPSVFYSTDGGTTWTEQAITGAVSTDVPTDMATVGQYLVISFDDGSTGGYWYSEINQITGVPGTWTKVTTGFVASSAPNAIYVESASAIWFAGDNGHVYKATNVLTGVTAEETTLAASNNLLAIDGLDEVICVVGGNYIAVSRDRGESFAEFQNFNSITHATAVQVMDDYLFWVGGDDGTGQTSDNGYVEWTKDGANNFTTLQLGTFAGVDEILFVTPEVGYISTYSSDPAATIWSTWNGGYSWTSGTPRILNLPTFDRASKLAAPLSPNLGVAVNTLAVGGLAGNGSDGIILIAEADRR